MSSQLHRALTEILAMPYYKNEHAKSGKVTYGHEQAVALVISRAGFQEHNRARFPNLKKSLLKRWAETGNSLELEKVLQNLPAGSYILQPAGTQGFPDILVKDFTNKYVALECKSGQSGLCPMWNDNVPRPDTVYILSSGVMNATTIFLGKDVIAQATYDLLKEQEQEILKIVKKYNALMLESDVFNRGWTQKSRKQHFQYGGNSKTNYFTHNDREKCEQNALRFALVQ